MSNLQRVRERERFDKKQSTDTTSSSKIISIGEGEVEKEPSVAESWRSMSLDALSAYDLQLAEYQRNDCVLIHIHFIFSVPLSLSLSLSLSLAVSLSLSLPPSPLVSLSLYLSVCLQRAHIHTPTLSPPNLLQSDCFYLSSSLPHLLSPLLSLSLPFLTFPFLTFPSLSLLFRS